MLMNACWVHIIAIPMHIATTPMVHTRAVAKMALQELATPVIAQVNVQENRFLLS